ncbi:MAG: hypothetical protein LBL26_03085 [Peptococcaceae bacterium]|jgi:hypothetical protein|nr:hypothetical protein [Peptococcaceae bacterium]
MKDIQIPTMPIRFPKVERDYPIPEKENLLLALHHQKPMWMPNITTSSLVAPSNGYGDTADTNPPKNNYTDSYGVLYEYSEAQGSATPVTTVLSEIGEWREKIKWPDLDKPDWQNMAAGFVRDETRALYGRVGIGCFERLHTLMGFEQTLMDLISEPEECRAFFEAYADYKIEVFKRMIRLYPYDYLMLNDDWGTAHGPFFSTDLFEETILPPTVRMIKAIHEYGIQVIFHSCGLIDTFVPYLVENIGADILQIQTINDIKSMLQTYGGRLTVEYQSPDPYILYDPETTEEQIRLLARQIVDTYGAQANPGGGCVVAVSAPTAEVYNIFNEEMYTYSLYQYKHLTR